MAISNKTLNNAELTNNLVNKFIVSPVVSLGIAGFAFDIFEEHKSEQQADITDHFVEDNSTIQDHIAIKPEKFTLRGFVGELVEERATPKSQVVELVERLTIINSYIPVVTNAAKQVNTLLATSRANKTEYLDASIGTGVDIYQAYKTLNPADTRQGKAYNFFKALFKAKQLVSFETPFGFQSNYAIENVVSVQGDNAYISDFSVTLKEFRTSKTKFVEFDKKTYQGRVNSQKAEEKNQGTAQGKPRNISFIKEGLNKFGITTAQ